MYDNDWYGSGKYFNTSLHTANPDITSPEYFDPRSFEIARFLIKPEGCVKDEPEIENTNNLEKSSSDEKQTKTYSKKRLNHKVKIKDVMVLAYMLNHAKK